MGVKATGPEVKFVKQANLDVVGERLGCLGKMCIQLALEKTRLITKTRGVISPLGEIIAHDVSSLAV